MIDVIILALDHTVPSGVLMTYDLFRMAGFTAPEGGGPRFSVRMITEDGRAITRSPVVEIKAQGSIDDVARADLVVIPSGGYSFKGLTGYSPGLTRWLRGLHRQGAVVAGICTGVFLLAEAGLLGESKATTHWAYADLFRSQFPDVDLEEDEIITQGDRVYCSGGGTAGLDLLIYLIEKYQGAECAKRCSALMLLDRWRGAQKPYKETLFEKDHDDSLILKAQLFMEKNVGSNLLLTDVAEHVGMSLRNFKRRFKIATGDAPLMYLQRLRMETAKQILENKKTRIEDLAACVGYEDLGFFRKLFMRYTGVSPSDYGKRFRSRFYRDGIQVE